MEELPVILLFGHNGQISWELRRSLAPLGHVISAGLDGADYSLDITDQKEMAAVFKKVKPQLIVNAAAYTSVDQAESEPELAHRINADAVGYMGQFAAAHDCPILHYSTDYVFSGQSDRPWRILDEPNPQNVYGHSKWAGEQALAHSHADYLIIRTAWLYSHRGHNFLLTMLKLLAEKNELKVIDDQFGAPTPARLVAEATAGLLIQCRQSPNRFYFGSKGGIYHLTCQGQASWYQFAEAIRSYTHRTNRILPIPSTEYPLPAQRPAYSVLDNTEIHAAFGLQLPHWRKALALCMEEIQC